MPIFGILCVEAFKSDDKKPALFRVLDQYLTSMLPFAERMGLSNLKVEDIRVAGFFFGLAPLLFFFLLQEKWVEYYQVDSTKLEEQFLGDFLRGYAEAVKPFVGARSGAGGSSLGGGQ